MSSPLDMTTGESQALIEDYLDYLCAPLLGIVPHAQRRRLRVEARDHLLALTEDFEAEGFAPEEAVMAALREYGEPWRVGQSFADAWLGGVAPSRLVRFADAVTLRAFGCFGPFAVLTLLLVEWSALGPYQDGLLPLTQCLAVLSPVLAGALTGLGLDSRAGVGICRSVALLGLVTAGAGLLLRPHMEGLLLAVFLFVFWLPMGCLSASVAASLRRQFLLRGFRRTVC